MSGEQAPTHHKRYTTSTEADDVDPLVDQQGCGKVYAELEECLGENDRDWRKCQKAVSKLKECYKNATGGSKGSSLDPR